MSSQRSDSQSTSMSLRTDKAASRQTSSLPGPRNLNDIVSERDLETSTGSVAALLKDSAGLARRLNASEDSSSLTKRLEAMEQQMLATHMRAAAAPEAAEVVAKNLVAPFSDEIVALRARVEMAEQQLQTCAASSQFERLSNRLAEAETRGSIGPADAMKNIGSGDNPETLARIEASVSMLSRQIHETGSKLQDLEREQQGHPDAHSIQQCVTDSVAALLQEQQSRQMSDVAAMRSRLEVLDQSMSSVSSQLTLVQRQVVDGGSRTNVDQGEVAALAERNVADIATLAGRLVALEQERSQQQWPALADRISAVEASYQEMGGAILRHQEAIRPLIENEIAGLVARLEAQEKTIQSTVAQAICRAHVLEDNEREKTSAQADMSDRLRNLEERLEAFADLSASTATLSARVALAEKQLASAPSNAELKKLQSAMEAAEMQCVKVAREALEVTSLGMSVSGTATVAATAEAPKESDISVENLRKQVEEMMRETTRLSEELAEERKERYVALADINRLSEVVAKAAASTIERAEQRFAQELGAEREILRQQLASAKETAMSIVSTSSAKDDRGETASLSGISDSNHSSLLKAGGKGSQGIGSDLARCVGEMDAELRVELTGCLDAVHKDLDSLRSDLMARIGAVEKRLGVIEGTAGAELKSVAAELGTYANHYNLKLENSVKSAETGRPRVNLRASSRNFSQDPSKVERVETGSGSSVNVSAASVGGTSQKLEGLMQPSPSAKLRDVSETLLASPNPMARQTSGQAPSVPKSGATGAMLTEMFQQAMKQMAPGGAQERQASPTRQPQISEDLKANLRNLVSAVNRTLGDGTETMPDRLSSVPLRSSSPQRNKSPIARGQTVPGPALNQADSKSVGSLQAPPSQSHTPAPPNQQQLSGVPPQIATAEVLPFGAVRGRSPDAEDRQGASPIRVTSASQSLHRSVSPSSAAAAPAPQSSVPVLGNSLAAQSRAAVTNSRPGSVAANARPGSLTGKGMPTPLQGSAKAGKDPGSSINMTWPNAAGAFARPVPSTGLQAAKLQPTSPTANASSPRGMSGTTVERGAARSGDSTSVPRMVAPSRPTAPPGMQASPMSQPNIRKNWRAS